MKTFPLFSRICLGLIALALTARADIIELVNGDHYRGFVIGMTASNVDFLSEIQGRVKLPRDKVAQITLHDVVPKVAAAPNTTNVTSATSAALAATPQFTQPQPQQQVVVQPLILSGPGMVPAQNQSGQSVIDQMRQQGVDPKLISEIQEQIFGKASPAAAAQFNQTMAGLMAGSVSVKDIRAQAQNSIAQIKQARQDLGPEADDLLDGYLNILQQFVNESATDNSITAAAPTK
jgi:hypothetical protein